MGVNQISTSLLKTEGLVEAFAKLKIKPDDEVFKTCALAVIAISKRLDKQDEAMVLMAKHLAPLSEEHNKLKKGFQQLVDELLKDESAAPAAVAGEGAAAAPSGPQQPFPAGFSPNAPAPGAAAAAASQGGVEEEEDENVDPRFIKPDVTSVVTHMAPNAPAGKVPSQPVPAPPPPVAPPAPAVNPNGIK